MIYPVVLPVVVFAAIIFTDRVAVAADCNYYGDDEVSVAQAQQTSEETLETTAALESTEAQTDQISDEEYSDSWVQQVQVTGYIDVDAYSDDQYGGTFNSDITLSTVSIEFSSVIECRYSFSVAYTYDETASAVDVDSAIAELQINSNFTVTAAKGAIPFGTYTTSLLTSSLTQDLGQASETYLKVGVAKGSLSGSIYVFNGNNIKTSSTADVWDNTIDNWGFDIGYWGEVGAVYFNTAFGYVNDIGEADGIDAYLLDSVENFITSRVSGWSASVSMSVSDYSMLGEYTAAADAFTADELPWMSGGATPHAWLLEFGWKKFALGYQGSRDALGLGLARSRYLVGYSTSLDGFDDTTLGIEWVHNVDYKETAASGDYFGTGDTQDTATIRLSVGF